MANFLFWLFTLATVLLIPGCMLYFGRRFQTRPPERINGGYGYRSTRSMQSQEAWDFAQVYSGRFWLRAGRPTLAVSLVWMLLLLGRDIGTVGSSAVVLTGLQLLPLLAVIPATERALKRKFQVSG
nr:SdpI family protein [uncultured Oscillibacter sp.]